MTLGISLTAPQFGRTFDPILELGELAVLSGLDGVFLFDHLVSLGGGQRPILELASCVGALAASTDHIQIGTLVIRATLRGPSLSVAIADTMAAIAPDRTVIGLGSGDSKTREECRRMGFPYETLDARLETLDRTANALVDRGHEVWIAGADPRIRAIASRVGGWNVWGIDHGSFGPLAAEQRQAGCKVTWGGRVLLAHDPDDLRELLVDRTNPPPIAGTADTVAAELIRFVDAGADHLVVSLIPNRPDRWRRFVDEVVPLVRKAVRKPTQARHPTALSVKRRFG